MVIPLAFLWIAAVIGCGEYHYRRFGQPRSWRLFGWVIAVELSILVLALFILPEILDNTFVKRRLVFGKKV